jgi:hypothetical protein
MGRKRKKDTVTVSVTRHHGKRVITRAVKSWEMDEEENFFSFVKQAFMAGPQQTEQTETQDNGNTDTDAGTPGNN